MALICCKKSTALKVMEKEGLLHQISKGNIRMLMAEGVPMKWVGHALEERMVSMSFQHLFFYGVRAVEIRIVEMCIMVMDEMNMRLDHGRFEMLLVIVEEQLMERQIESINSHEKKECNASLNFLPAELIFI